MPTYKPITVIANPWHALDADGRAACHLTILGTDVIIGGHINFPESRRRGVFCVDFDAGPVTLRPASLAEVGFYLRAIQDGALFAADAETALQAGVPWLAPLVALAQARTDALAAYEAQTGHPPIEPPAPPAAPAPAPEPPEPPLVAPSSETFVVPSPDAPAPGFQPVPEE